MRKLVNDLTGKKFGRLTVIGVADDGKRKTSYICQCDCGNATKVRADALIAGTTKSCGCLKRESDRKNVSKVPSNLIMKDRGFKVGGTRLYSIWQGMKSRCYRKSTPCYERYGGRGIRVCEEWENDYLAFYNWAVNNGYSDDLTIDRINPDGNYEPNNCHWATNEQQGNNRRTNINIKIGNATKTLKEWCDIFEVDYKKVNARYHRNGFESIDRLFNDILK